MAFEPSGVAARSASGYAAWRLIAEELRAEIAEGGLGVGDRLPPEVELAERFGVNRHTVRQGVAALAAEGLVEARRGSGTYVTGGPRLVHRIGLRTRFSRSLGSEPAAGSRSMAVLEAVGERVPTVVCERLGIAAGSDGVRVEILGALDGLPISRATHWFEADRFPDIAAQLRAHGSVTLALRAAGIEDYVRLSTTVTARQATVQETIELELPPGSVVLVTIAVDALPEGTPIQQIVTRFAAQRVALDIEHPPPG